MIDRPDLFSRLCAHLERIAPIPDSERSRIEPILRVRTVCRGDYIMRPGDSIDWIGYICSGLVRYFFVDHEGREFTRYFCVADHFLSAPGGEEGYAIRAVIDTELLAVRRLDWLRLVDVHPYWGRVTMAVQQYALALAERRERLLVLGDATERYLDLLECYPGIEEHVKQYEIASYLGVTPVALSRIRGQALRRRPRN